MLTSSILVVNIVYYAFFIIGSEYSATATKQGSIRVHYYEAL